MESKKELYKQRGKKGLADRGFRAKQREEASRNQRNNLLLSKRRIPLAAIQEEEKDTKFSLKDKQLDRLEKLKEWKRQRDEAKKQAEMKKPRPFVSAATKPTCRQPISFTFGIKNSTSEEKLSKKTVTAAENREKPATTPASKLTLSTKAASTAKNPPVPKEPGPNRSKRNPKTSGPPAGKSVPKRSIIARGPQKPNTRSSARVAATKQEAKPPASARSTVSSTGSRGVATRTASAGKNSKTATVNQQKATKNTGVRSTTSKSTVSTRSSSRLSTKKATQEKLRNSKPTSTKRTLEQSDSSTKFPPKVDPTSNISVQPSPRYISPEAVHPSPLVHPNSGYISVRPTSQVQNATVPLLVNDPAWIPNAKVQVYDSEPNFTEVFGSSPFRPFSPFQFTGVLKQSKSSKYTPKQPFTFTFRKSISNTPSSLLKQSLQSTKLNMSTDSLADTSVAERVPGTPDIYKEKRRSIHSLSQLTLSARTVVHEHNNSLIVEVIPDPDLETGMEPEQEAALEPDDLLPPSPEEHSETSDQNDADASPSLIQESEGAAGIDFVYFRGLHSGVTEKLTPLCQLWEGKSSVLEAPREGEEITEEVLGQIRTTVCQAQLLMRQKLKQYLRLVEEAANQSGARPSSAEDLQGFWDMVYFQVEDILRKFEALSELESNDWKQQTTKKPKTRRGKKRVTATTQKPPVAPSDAENDRQRAAREKREAARNRLREIKAAAKRAREEEAEAESANGGGALIIEVLMSPKTKKSKEDSEESHRSAKRKSLRKTPSKYRRTSALIKFDDSLQDDPLPTNSQSDSESANPSVFSPPMSSSEQSTGDVPTARLLSFTPGKVPKTPQKASEGAFQKMYISITPSKRVRDLIGADVIMSPARRSLRLADKATAQLTVSSIMEIPDGIDFAYCPNGALM